jgi:hypothetical protein
MKLSKKASGDAEILEIRISNYITLFIYGSFPAIAIAFTLLMLTSIAFGVVEWNTQQIIVMFAFDLVLSIPAALVWRAMKKPFVVITKKNGSIEVFLNIWLLKLLKPEKRKYSIGIREIESIGDNDSALARLCQGSLPWAFLKNKDKKPLAPAYTREGLPWIDPLSFSQEEIKQVAEFVGVPFREKKGLLEQAKEKLSKTGK